LDNISFLIDNTNNSNNDSQFQWSVRNYMFFSHFLCRNNGT
jgi:hypothetical protein